MKIQRAYKFCRAGLPLASRLGWWEEWQAKHRPWSNPGPWGPSNIAARRWWSVL